MKKPITRLLLFILLCAGNIAGFTQEKRQITGTVRDSANVLSGVTISVKGTKTSTLSDAGGNFKISASPNDMLVFNFVGYEQREIKVGNQSALNITLRSSSANLEGVVVTALGIRREQRKLGYATSQVSGKDIIKTAPTNLVHTLRQSAGCNH